MSNSVFFANNSNIERQRPRRYITSCFLSMELNQWVEQREKRKTPTLSARWLSATQMRSASSRMRLCRLLKISLMQSSTTLDRCQLNTKKESMLQLVGICHGPSTSSLLLSVNAAEIFQGIDWRDQLLQKESWPGRGSKSAVFGLNAWTWCSRSIWAGKKQQIADIASNAPDVLHSLSVLNTPPKSGCRARQTCGFFTSIEFYGRVACSTYNTPKGKNYRPTLSGVQVPGHPTEHGVMNNLRGRTS